MKLVGYSRELRVTKITLNTSIALVAFRNMWFCFTSQTFPSSGNIQGRSLAFFYRLAYVGTVLEKLASRLGSICSVQFWDFVGALVAMCPPPFAVVSPCWWWIGWVRKRSQFGLKYLWNGWKLSRWGEWIWVYLPSRPPPRIKPSSPDPADCRRRSTIERVVG